MNRIETPARSEPEVSHTYQLAGRDLAVNLATTIGIVLVASAMALGSVWAGILPRSAYRSDPDSMIIATKAALARSSGDANIGLVGDSSCLINLDVATLRKIPALRPINLGTLSYLSLDSMGKIASEYCQGRTSPKVLLTLHPDCIRAAVDSAAHRGLLESALGQGKVIQLRANNPVSDALGFEDIRTRVVDRWVPEPLKGALGVRYGFTEYIEAELRGRLGTMDETGRFDPKTNSGSGEYRLAARTKSQAEFFRTQLPRVARIRLLISPVPQSHAQKNHIETMSGIRTELESLLKAEGPAWDLPLILPDDQFGTVTHLLPEAAKRYSEDVAQRLATWK